MPEKPLRAEDLRDAKDFLVDGIAHQAREFGLLPDVAAHEEFVAPILRKIEVDHEEERQAALAAPPTPAPDPDRPLGPREVRWDPETGATRVGAELQRELDEEQAQEADQDRIAHRIYLRMLLEKPDWKARIVRIVGSPDLDATSKRLKLHDLFEDSFRYFGHPRALLETAKTVMDMGRRGAVLPKG